MPSDPQMFLLIGAPDQRGGVTPYRFLLFAWGADGVQQDCQRPAVRCHVVALGWRLPPIDVGREGALSGGAMPDGPLAFSQDVLPVAPGVTVQDRLVARRVRH